MNSIYGVPRCSVGAGACSGVFGAIVPKALRSAKHPATWGALFGGPRRNVGVGACSGVSGAVVPEALRSASHPATWGGL